MCLMGAPATAGCVAGLGVGQGGWLREGEGGNGRLRILGQGTGGEGRRGAASPTVLRVLRVVGAWLEEREIGGKEKGRRWIKVRG